MSVYDWNGAPPPWNVLGPEIAAAVNHVIGVVDSRTRVPRRVAREKPLAGRVPLGCPHCGKAYHGAAALARHTQTRHPEVACRG